MPSYRRGPDLPLGPLVLNSGSGLFRGLVGTNVIRSMADAFQPLYPKRAAFAPEGGIYANTKGAIGDGTDNLLYRTGALTTNVPVSLAAWFTPYTTTGAHSIITQGQEAATGALLSIAQATLTAQYAIRTIGGGGISAPAGGTMTVGIPNHIVGVSYSVTDHRVFLNGIQVATDTTAIDASPADWQNTAVGALRRDTTANFFNGAISQWAIWNRALTAAEVWSLYDPSTRWDLYWTQKKRFYFVNEQAAAAGYLLVKN